MSQTLIWTAASLDIWEMQLAALEFKLIGEKKPDTDTYKKYNLLFLDDIRSSIIASVTLVRILLRN